MADEEQVETQEGLDARLAAALPKLSEACLGRRVEIGEVVSVNTAEIEMRDMSLEDVVQLAVDHLAPKIHEVIAAVGALKGASVLVRLELPCKERLPDGRGGSESLSMTLPFGTIANSASARMNVAVKYSLADDPRDEVSRAQGRMLRAFELDGSIRWASEAHKQRAIQARPMFGVGMDDVDAAVVRKQERYAETHGTVD